MRWNLGVLEMPWMRNLLATVSTICCLAGVSAASAADLSTDGSYATRSYAIGERATPLLTYDYQPGVAVRAYWHAPWRNRHYFPFTGERPEIGRDEDLSAPRMRTAPGATYKRYWSTSFMPDQPFASPPAVMPPKTPGPLK
jgi:hypothetical protein